MTSTNIDNAKNILQAFISNKNELFKLCILKIEAHIYPVNFSYALCELKKHELLTLPNINTLEKYINPQSIRDALAAMPKTLATQENLDQLFALKNTEFLDYLGYLLHRTQENQLSQIVFDQFIQLSENSDSKNQIKQLINQLLSAAIMPDENNNNPPSPLALRR